MIKRELSADEVGKLENISQDAVIQKTNETTTAPAITNDNTEGYGVGSVWIDTATDKAYICVDDSTGAAVWKETTGGVGAGEANTASNVGTGGVGLFKQKTGVDLEFKNINAGSNKVTVTNDVANNEIDIDVNESNLSLTASQITDFDTEVSNNTDVTNNTAKVSNATHTGEVTGSTTLTVSETAISNKALKSTLAGTEEVLINDGGTLKKTTSQYIANLGGGGTNTEIIDFGSHNNFERGSNMSAYSTMRKLVFRGSTDVGSPTSIKFVGRIEAGGTGKVRVYDITSSLVIAELTGISNTTDTVLSLGAISNVPTGSAVWAVDIAGDGTKQMFISSLSIKY